MNMNSVLEEFENTHSSGNVSGLTYLDYFILPFNARICF